VHRYREIKLSSMRTAVVRRRAIVAARARREMAQRREGREFGEARENSLRYE